MGGFQPAGFPAYDSAAGWLGVPGVIRSLGFAHHLLVFVVRHEPEFEFCTQAVHEVGDAVSQVVDLAYAE